MSEPARAAASSWPALDAALGRLPYADAERLKGELERATDPRVLRELADHVIVSARLLRDPGFLRAIDDVRRNPPDWSAPERSLEEWRALVDDANSAR